MATFAKFNTFTQEVLKGTHHFGTDTFKIALVASASGVSASGDAVLTDITQIAYTNLTTAPTASFGVDIPEPTTDSGVAKVAVPDITITASGGNGAAWRYAVLYNDSHASKALVGYIDVCGADITILDGLGFLLDFDTSNGTFTI
jgi:hypothetical protein